ncbi:hypothetical protein BgAZ_300570 [Babesia gibsoni]|uniref:Uncharacterized protein n=1 Tax=Babesia gibsoni TaxID=33632 RepID=A0AAD8LKK6_BABGI|nr:hypothetical protein BgAZ_300570 [Babesia gibsoni]
MAKPPGKRGRKQADSDDSDSDATPSKGTTTGGFKNRDTIDLRIAVDQDSLDCENACLSVHHGCPPITAAPDATRYTRTTIVGRI